MPYHYVSNNPIMFTDPTGMEADHIIIRGEKESYNYDSKKTYKGNDKFIKSTIVAMNELKNSSTGNSMIEELDSSNHNFYIQSGTDNNFEPLSQNFADPSRATKFTKDLNKKGKIGSGGTINWNQKEMRLPTTTNANTSKEIILGHEMAHALDSNRGKLDRTLEGVVKKSEWQAVYRENLIRTELGLPIRTHYGIELEPGTNSYLRGLKPKMVGKNNEIIKPSWYE